MEIKNRVLVFAVAAMLFPIGAKAQYATDAPQEPASDSTVVLTLEDAIKIALSENISVKVADKEITRSEYEKKGTYASLFPQIDLSGTYTRTIQKQVTYMDVDMSSLFGGSDDTTSDDTSSTDDSSSSSSSNDGFSVGRDNTFSAGISASMPLVNFELWKSIQISGDAVELAVEEARSSRLDMVTQVKQAYYAVLLAKESFEVYKSVYENAVENFGNVEKKYNASKASELEYIRAKSNVASAVPNVYNSESQIVLALWQLKAVMGVDLDMDIDVAGNLEDYTDEMFREVNEAGQADLSGNTSLRQLAIQAEQMAKTIQMKKYANLPTLSVSFSYSKNAMTNDFKFSEFNWTPYAYAGLSLSIPIFSGGKRYNDIRSAKIQKEELDLQKINTERELQISVRQYVTTMETNMRSYYAALEAVELAQKSYDITAKSYSIGKSTITDLNDAQLSLTQAELEKSQAIYDYMVAKSNLEQTIGHDFLDEDGNVSFN